MINATLWNLLKAVGIAVLITCVISGLYGSAGLLLGLSEDSEVLDVRRILGYALSGFVGSFACILPVVWLITFALLQRRLTKRPSTPQD